MTKDRLEDYLESLANAATDEETLISLTMLPRILDSSDPAAIERAFDTMPWKFVHRMLVSPEPLMQEVGVHIWSSFCIDPYLNTSRITKRLLPITNLLKSDCPTKDIIMESVIRCVSSSTNWDSLNPIVLENVWAGIGIDNHKVQLMDLILNSHSTNRKLLGDMLDVCIALLENKNLEGLRIARNIMFSEDLDVPRFIPKLKRTISGILKSKLSKEWIEMVICISALMSSFEEFYKTQVSEFLTESQFWVLLIHLTGTEVRISLDETTDNVDAYSSSIFMFYLLLENIIGYLVEGKINLDSSSLNSVRNSLGETYYTVASFLSERWAQYQDSNNLKFLNNSLLIFSYKSYCRWVAEESAISLDELTSLTPLVVKILQMNEFCVEYDPFGGSLELLTTITSMPETAELFIDLGGDTLILGEFIKNERNRYALLDSVLLNLIVSKGVTNWSFLEKRAKSYSPAIPILLSYIENDEDLVTSFNALTCYLFLYRSSKEYQKHPLPFEKIIGLLEMRYKSDFPEDIVEFFELIVLALADCIPNKIEHARKLDFVTRLENFKSKSTVSSEVESLQAIIENLNL